MSVLQRRKLVIECGGPSGKKHSFVTESSKIAQYLLNLCSSQHKFHSEMTSRQLNHTMIPGEKTSEIPCSYRFSLLIHEKQHIKVILLPSLTSCQILINASLFVQMKTYLPTGLVAWAWSGYLAQRACWTMWGWHLDNQILSLSPATIWQPSLRLGSASRERWGGRWADSWTRSCLKQETSGMSKSGSVGGSPWWWWWLWWRWW